jgi:hypothetical protein
MAHMMITDVPIFDRDLRKASTLRPVTITDVRGFIKAHYLRRAPAVPVSGTCRGTVRVRRVLGSPGRI